MIKLKDEFLGMIITRTRVGVGQITFDANKATQEQYENFQKYGFDDLFEEVAAVSEERAPELFDCCNQEVCTCEKKEEKEEEKEELADELTDLDRAKEQVKNYSKKKK